MTRPGGCCCGGLWGEVTGKMPVPLCLVRGHRQDACVTLFGTRSRVGHPCYVACWGWGMGSSAGFFAWGLVGDVGEEGAEGGEGGGVGGVGGEVVDFGGVGGEVEELGAGDERVVDAFPAAVGDGALEVAVGGGDVLSGGVLVL